MRLLIGLLFVLSFHVVSFARQADSDMDPAAIRALEQAKLIEQFGEPRRIEFLQAEAARGKPAQADNDAFRSEIESSIIQQSIEDFAKRSQEPSFAVFPGDAKIELVSMREFFVAGPADGVPYAGTFGLGPCIGVIVVGRKAGGEIVRVGLAHIDAICNVAESNAFFWQALEGADEADVYLLASQGDAKTALKVREKLEQVSSFQKVSLTYFVDLRGPSQIAVNVNTGEVYNQFDIFNDAVQSKEELDRDARQLILVVGTPSPLRHSKGMRRVYQKRMENK